MGEGEGERVRGKSGRKREAGGTDRPCSRSNRNEMLFFFFFFVQIHVLRSCKVVSFE